jgi:hypothetical protein
MDPTEKRLSKLRDYSDICLSTLGNAGLTLALLKPLIEDRGLQNKHAEAGVFIAHQHLANTLFGSFLTEAISIAEGSGKTQASLAQIRLSLNCPDVIQKLEVSWRNAWETRWDDPDALLNESALERLRERDAKKRSDHFHELKRSIQESYDDLIESPLYRNSKTARDRVLAHKDTWKCETSGTWRNEWFDRIGLGYSDAWTLYRHLGEISKECHLLLTQNSYVLGYLDDQSDCIATRFWLNE